MLEAAALYIVAQQRVNDRVPILDKPGVGIRVDAQSGQRGNDLRNGFAGGDLRRAVVGGGVAAVLVLHLGEPRDGLVDGLLHLQILRVIGSQSCQGHAGHVGVSLVAGDGPAAVRGLHTQQLINEGLPGGGAAGGGRVVAGIQCQQRPDGAVVALVLDVLQVAETLQQVVAANVGHLLANGRQGQNHPAVIRGLGLVQPVGFGVDAAFNVLQSLLVVVLHAGDRPSGAGQADDHPFAAYSADAGSAQLLHVVAGGNVGVAYLTHGFQHRQLGFRGGQYIVVVHQQLLQVGQCVIGFPGRLNVLFGIQGDIGQLLDEVNNLLCLFLVLGGSRQLGVSLFRVRQLLGVGNQTLLGIGQAVVGFPGRLDAGLALFGDRLPDLVNELDHLIRFQLIPFLGGLLQSVEILYQCFLLRRQGVVDVPGVADGRAAVGGDGADFADQVVHIRCPRLHQPLVLGLCLSKGSEIVGTDLVLFSSSQRVISTPGRIDSLLASVRVGHSTDLVDQVNDLLGGAGVLGRSHTTLFLGIIVSIVQNDYVTLL